MGRLPLLVGLAAGLALAGCLGAGPSTSSPSEVGAPGDKAPEAGPDLSEPVENLRTRVREALEGGGTVAVEARTVRDEVVYGQRVGERSTETFEVEPAPSPILRNGTWVEVEGERVEGPFVEAYGGHVAGNPEAPFRLVLADDWARGVVRTGDRYHQIRVGLEGNVPTSRDDARTSPTRASAPLPYEEPGGGTPAQECVRFVPEHVEPTVDAGPNQDEVVWTDVVMDGGPDAAATLEDDAVPLLVSMLHEIDPIYEHEVGVRFRLEGVHLHQEAERFPDADEKGPLDAVADYWNDRDVDRDLVHFVSGKDYAFAGANCTGGAGHPELAYTFTPLPWARNGAYRHTSGFAHEVGHIFGADHHHANNAETVGATTMLQGYAPGTRPVFSTLSKSVIRGWAEAEVAEDGAGDSAAGPGVAPISE